jgi:hypothetical protein
MASLESLEPQSALILELLIREGKSYDEVATMLDVSPTRLREQAHAAPMRLRQRRALRLRMSGVPGSPITWSRSRVRSRSRLASAISRTPRRPQAGHASYSSPSHPSLKALANPRKALANPRSLRQAKSVTCFLALAAFARVESSTHSRSRDRERRGFWLPAIDQGTVLLSEFGSRARRRFMPSATFPV